MKVYTVDIDSYETDNSCATYHYSNDYVTFEEAQNALEKEFWEFEKSHGLTEKDSRYNKNTGTFEEIPDSDYVYTFEVASDNFNIGDSWSNYSGEIFEKEISNSLPNGHWYFVDKHGLPTENGKYLCSLQDWEGHKYTKYVLFSATTQRFFTIRGHEVYAWTELIQPA